MDRLFGLDHPAKPEGLCLLRSFFDSVSVSIAEQALQDADIPFLKKERGSGSAVRIIVGFQRFGTDLFVQEEHLEAASDIMQSLFDSDTEEVEQ